MLRDAKDSKPQSFPLSLTVRLHEVSRFRNITSPNVVAVLPGREPELKREYVVYTAHADHLGIGEPVNGDSIYNGAADDATGISALVMIADAFKALPQASARSILFLAVTDEEEGLLGSDYFAHYPTVPIANIAANINMDGADVFFRFKSIIAIGAEHGTLEEIVKRDAGRLNLKVSPDPNPEQVYFIRSDQYSFVRQGVPSLFISGAPDAEDPKIDGKKFREDWIRTRYHAPSDDMNQHFDFSAAVQFMQVDFLIGYDIANDAHRPFWKPGDFFGETFARR